MIKRLVLSCCQTLSSLMPARQNIALSGSPHNTKRRPQFKTLRTAGWYRRFAIGVYNLQTVSIRIGLIFCFFSIKGKEEKKPIGTCFRKEKKAVFHRKRSSQFLSLSCRDSRNEVMPRKSNLDIPVLFKYPIHGAPAATH